MKSAALKRIVLALRTVVSVYLTVIVTVALFHAFLRLIGTLGADRFRGNPAIPAVERHLLTLWYDARDADRFANLVAPVVVVALVFLPERLKTVRWLVWILAFPMSYQLLVEGGWGEMLGRQGGLGYLLLLFGGVFGAFFQPLLDGVLWRTLGKLHQTRILENAS